ncbi:MAG: nucleotidyltransferase family protein, partial [Oscillospiraceae bacterium]|nr:nucleotidyltransferase family protein [Oscillospiraceae bacterium]
TREAGATHVLAIMSGSFTQRGGVAVFDKFTRTKTALENGIDLVIELPARFSLTSAAGFARGAVDIAAALGCVEMLAFGSESGDLAALKEASGAIDYTVHTAEFDELIQRGNSYPAALQKALRQFYTDDVAELIASPNNTLAIEYLNALDTRGSTIESFTVRRYGAAHNEELDESSRSEFLSGSAIRKLISEGKDYSDYAPLVAAPSADLSRLERAILANLRALLQNDLERVADCAGGLGERLYKAIRKGTSLSGIYFMTKTKRYTLARIRRAVLCGFLGIDKEISREKCAYIRVLGMNARGKEILSAANCPLPIDTSLKALSKTSPEARRQAEFEARLTDIYGLAFEEPPVCGLDFTSKPIILD